MDWLDSSAALELIAEILGIAYYPDQAKRISEFLESLYFDAFKAGQTDGMEIVSSYDRRSAR